MAFLSNITCLLLKDFVQPLEFCPKAIENWRDSDLAFARIQGYFASRLKAVFASEEKGIKNVSLEVFLKAREVRE